MTAGARSRNFGRVVRHLGLRTTMTSLPRSRSDPSNGRPVRQLRDDSNNSGPQTLASQSCLSLTSIRPGRGGMEIGYARVSTREEGQAFNRQLDADEAASCDQAPADRGSGRRAPLPRLNACFEYRSGELIRFVEDREDRGVGFRALNAAFDTTTSAGAPPRRSRWRSPRRGPNRIRPCSTDRAAFSSGRTGGRPRVMTLEKLRHVQHLIADQSRSIPAICRELGAMPAST